jgi:hypothetical protein
MKILEIYNELGAEKVFYHGSAHVFDRFDFDRIGSGDGLSVFGHGLYFTDTYETAVFYAKDLSIGKLKSTGFNLYTVSIRGLDNFYNWEEETPHHVAERIVKKLIKAGHTDDAELIENEFNDYGNYWELNSMYEILTGILGSKKEVSEFLDMCGVSGVIGKSRSQSGLVYTVYDDRLIKILNVEKV